MYRKITRFNLIASQQSLTVLVCFKTKTKMALNFWCARLELSKSATELRMQEAA